MLKAIKKSLGTSQQTSPVVQAQSFAYPEEDLESNSSSIASSQSASTFYSALTHLSDAGDVFDRQSLNSNSEQDAVSENVSIRQIVEDHSMLKHLRQVALNFDRKKNFKESYAILTEYREAANHFLPKGHAHSWKILNYIADHFIAQRLLSSAESSLVECCRIKEESIGASDTRTIKSKIKLAAVFQLLGKIQMCEDELDDCLTACIEAPLPHVRCFFLI
jgi:hypothetical protein